MARFSIPTLMLALVVASCGPAEPEGQFHERLCDIAFINEDFLTGAMDEDWRERRPERGSFVVDSEGSGDDKTGWMTITADGGDISEAARDAYRLVHVAPSQDYRMRLQLTGVPSGDGQFSGLVAEQSEDSFVAFGLRGSGSSVTPELLAFEEGTLVFSAAGEPVDPGSVLLVLVRVGDEWIATIGETEIGRGELALTRSGADVGMVLASPGGSASQRVEWIEGCPYYRGRD